MPGAPGSTPIIAVTANAREDSIKATLGAGAVAVVEKPIMPKSLLDAIRAATSGRQARTSSMLRRHA